MLLGQTADDTCKLLHLGGALGEDVLPHTGHSVGIEGGGHGFEEGFVVVDRQIDAFQHRQINDFLHGLEDFSHIWLVWQFSGAVRDSWSPTVRPPRLGGNTRMGVFATRSPFRPNPLGLSSVQLEAIEHRPDVGPVLIVRGADLMDGTPIYDIKPYIPYADCHPDAAAGFTAQTQFHHLTMVCDAGLWARVPADQQAALQGVLENDPRPSYQHDPERVYGMEFGGLEVHFKVDGEVLTVTGIDRR